MRIVLTVTITILIIVGIAAILYYGRHWASHGDPEATLLLVFGLVLAVGVWNPRWIFGPAPMPPKRDPQFYKGYRPAHKLGQKTDTRV